MFAPTLLLLAAALAAPPREAPQSRSPEQPPPQEMIDFFGRRRLCLDLQVENGVEVAPFVREERARLACDRLPEEERAYRKRYAGDALVTAWLNDDPRRFHLPDLVVSSQDGPPLVHPRRFEESGTEASGKVPFKVVIETEPGEGGLTRVTASFGDLPPRTVILDNERFPWIDLRTIEIALGPRAETGRLSIDIRYGYPRGYCHLPEDQWQERPELRLTFKRDAVDGSYRDRVNCRLDWTPLPL